MRDCRFSNELDEAVSFSRARRASTRASSGLLDVASLTPVPMTARSPRIAAAIGHGFGRVISVASSVRSLLSRGRLAFHDRRIVCMPAVQAFEVNLQFRRDPLSGRKHFFSNM